jgi:hypothetical protein
MTINDFIQQVQHLAAQDLKGGDAELVLWDRTNDRELRVNPDADVFDFELTRGDGELVIEFD